MENKPQIENLENSAVKMTVSINKDEVKKEYDSLISKYIKEVQIKGFRKGKVPPAVFERKFKKELEGETLSNLLDKSLQEAFEKVEEKPLAYARPELDKEPEFSLDDDIKFSVVYDVYPSFELGEYKGIEIQEPQIKISQEDEEKELKALQEQNSMIMDKKDGTVAKDDIITIDYAELDEEDKEKDGTKRQDFVFTVGSGENFYGIDDDVIGIKHNEEKIIEKDYPEDHQFKELAGKKIKLKVKVTKIKYKDLPQIDDELAQDINDNFETLDDLKADIQSKLKESAKNRVKQQMLNQVIDKIIDNTEIPLPNTMVNLQLEESWRNFMSQMRISEEQVKQILKAQGKSKEAMLEEWRPDAVKRVKQSLIMKKIAEKESLEVSDEELDNDLEAQAKAANQSAADLKNFLKQNNLLEVFKNEILERKTADFVLEQAKKTAGIEMSFSEAMGQQPNPEK